MKWLFILLVIANLSYYFWPTEPPLDNSEDPHQTARPTIDAPTILLIKEAQQRQLYPTAEPMDATAPPTDVGVSEHESAQHRTDASKTATEAAGTAVSPSADKPVQVAAAKSDTTPAESAPPPKGSTSTRRNTTRDTPSATTDTKRAASDAKQSAETATAPLAPEVGDNKPKTTNSTASTTAITDDACFRLGPFKSLASAAIAKKHAVDLGFRGKLLQATGQESFSYVIYLGPFEDPDKRLKTMNELFDADIGDILIGKGEHLNSLVTGDFSSREAAAEKVAELEKLGYKPRLAKESRRRTRFYLDLSSPDGSRSRTSADTLKQNFPDTALKGTACKTRSRR